MMVLWLLSCLICIPVCYGWNLAHIGKGSNVNRDDMGESMLFAMMLSTLGIIGIIFGYCITGFAEHGWRYR